jgi:YebC/PmpR family DNA-binding regulatory protein
MSGHSKWSTIKRQKGVADAKRGQQFSKLSRAITIAAKQGGVDPASNPRLRVAIEAARAASMPKDNIGRAIDKASGSNADTIEEITYEGYGPGGAALLLEVVTDNRNRTVAEVRSIFNKLGGSMSEAGSVSWMFTPQAMVSLELGSNDPDEVSLAAIEAGASDLEVDNGALTVMADPASLTAISQALQSYGEIETDLQLMASNTIELDKEQQQKLLNLMETLDEHEDIQRVSTNALLD